MPDRDPARPAAYPRRVLVASLGLAPQVLTETLFCLAEADDPWLPTEIHVVTTAAGRDRAQRLLLEPPAAQLAQLAARVGAPHLAAALTRERIHVVGAAADTPLGDIVSLEDNAATADLIADLIRSLSADPAAALHVSIAGGARP